MTSLLPLVFALSALSPSHPLPPLPRPDLPDKGAPFLKVPALSIAHLLHEVQSSSVVRTRYAHFFHLPVNDVVPFFRKNALSSTLPHNGLYTVYFVSHSGHVYPAWMRLPAGTPIFIARDHQPLLLRGTGDPFVPFAEAVDVETLPAPAAPPKEEELIVPAASPAMPVPTAPTAVYPDTHDANAPTAKQ